MLPEVVAALACPHDGAPLLLQERTLGCEHGHRFDLAKQGYATLIAKPLVHHGDDAVMVERRQRVHAAGVLGALHDAVVAAADSAAPAHGAAPAGGETSAARRPSAAPAGGETSAARRPSAAPAGGETSAARRPDTPRAPAAVRGPWPATRPRGLVCDVGAGPGTYLAAVLERLPEHTGVAIDVSKAAARRAARCHPRASAVVADVWTRLPLRTDSATLLLDVFAPRNAGEFARVLVPDGTLVVVTPDVDHLAELRSAVGLLDVPAGKAAQVADALERGFRLVATTRVRERVTISPELAGDLARMGPSGHHLDAVPAPPPADGSAPPPADGSGPRGRSDVAITVTIAATVSRFERTQDT